MGGYVGGLGYGGVGGLGCCGVGGVGVGPRFTSTGVILVLFILLVIILRSCLY